MALRITLVLMGEM